jgi:hypothetical protein
MRDVSPRLLTIAFVTWRKRVIGYYLAGCRKHQEEASDRMDYITVLRSGHLFQTGKMTPQQWIEGRRKLRKECAETGN